MISPSASVIFFAGCLLALFGLAVDSAIGLFASDSTIVSTVRDHFELSCWSVSRLRFLLDVAKVVFKLSSDAIGVWAAWLAMDLVFRFRGDMASTTRAVSRARREVRILV